MGHQPRLHRHRTELDDVRDDPHSQSLLEQVLGDHAERDPGRGLPGAGALQDRPGIGVAVLLHPGQVGVPRPGAGQRSVAGLAFEEGRVDGVGRHHRLPLRPLAVADPDRHRAAQGQAVAHAAEDLHLVLLERHPGPAAVPEPPPGKILSQVRAGHRHAGWDALQHGHQRRAVRLTRGQPTHTHASQSVTSRPARRVGPAASARAADRGRWRTRRGTMRSPNGDSRRAGRWCR